MEQDLRDPRQRVLDAAEALFLERGYTAITLRDIADDLGIKQASLYYHFPEGKEQLFMTMSERLFDRHTHGLNAAMAAAEPDLYAQLQAAASWFGSQRPVSVLGMLHSDMQSLSAEHTGRLSRLAHQALFTPIRNAFLRAWERGEAGNYHPDMVAGSFLWLLDGVNYTRKRDVTLSRDEMVDQLITMLLDGIRPRPSPPEERLPLSQQVASG